MMPTTRSLVVILAVCAAFVSSAIDGRAQTTIPIEKARLWVNDYQALHIVVEDLSQAEKDLGLTRERIQTKVELRLRQAGIRPRSQIGPSHYVYVRVSALGAMFHVDVKFDRFAEFTLPNGESYSMFVTTWTSSAMGTHGRDSEYIIGIVDQGLDEFLNEYPKANQQ